MHTPPRRVYVDGKFLSPMSVRRWPLLVTSENISWRGKSIELYRVTGIGYWILPVKATTGQLMGYNYTINLSSNEGRFSATFYAIKQDKEAASAFQTTVAVLRTLVEPRVLGELLARIDLGDRIKIRSLTFSREGIYKRGFLHSKFTAWSPTVESRPSSLGTNLSTLHIYTQDTRNHRRKIGGIESHIPNAVLVPAIIENCIRRYGR